MSRVESFSWKSGDDLDDLLRTFFRAQMPHPWPAPRLSPVRPVASRRPALWKQPLIRSRWALAASIALLLVGSLLLPGRLTQGNKSLNVLNGSLLNENSFHKQMKKGQQRKKLEDKNKVGQGVEDDDSIFFLDDSELSSLK